MTRKRKSQAVFEEVAFDSEVDDETEPYGRGGSNHSSSEKHKKRKENREMVDTSMKTNVEQMNRKSIKIQSKHKIAPGEVGLGKKRKKRKRKPRNNKYEGMSKKSSDVKATETQSRKLDREEADSNTGTSKMREEEEKKKNAVKEKPSLWDNETIQEEHGSHQSAPVEAPPTGIIYASTKKKKISKISRASWSEQLKSARFRFINETLYKSKGEESFQKFKGDRSLFEVYHEGYNRQIEQWPENPVDVIIRYLNTRPQTWTVGDFGCGEAKIAQSVRQKVYSFDIFPANDKVTVCNISKVPLKSDSLDVAVYCLSLMGINWIDYLREANRVLKPRGILKIAEVASRFQEVGAFIDVLYKLGFQVKAKDLSNKMFYLFEFVKRNSGQEVPEKFASILKPCAYKRR